VVGGVSTKLVAACNKNGLFYAWRQTNLAAGPVWQRRVGQSAAAGGSCLTSAAYDSSSQRLFVGANQTTIGGQTVPGSIRALNPSTGAVLWGQPLGCRVTGSPTLAGATHVLAVPLYACSGTAHPGVALFNATTGAPLRTLTAAANVFAQPIMAEGHLYIADESGTLSAYVP
jgi:outer membrane protein assembly factor BamB